MSTTGAMCGLWIENEPLHGGAGGIALFDPSTGDEIGTVSGASAADVDTSVRSARAAAALWADVTPIERGRMCRRIGELLLERRSELAQTIIRDAGLPLSLALRDVDLAARYFEYYSGLPDKFASDAIPMGPRAVDFTLREPWGVCAVILPFNFPLQLAARDLAPALATGNTVVLKAPEQAPLAAMALAETCRDAGLAPGTVNAIVGTGSEAGRALVEHCEIDHITFTGSQATARLVLASAARSITPAVIELGGKSPHIVFDDANLEAVVRTVVDTTFRTAGQACSAGTRLLADPRIHAQLTELLVGAVASLTVGPAAGDPDVGPLISAVQRDAVLEAVVLATRSGARLLVGGGRPENGIAPAGGFYVQPTVLNNVEPLSPAAQEEIFGPVLTIMPFEGEAQAVELANATEFGLVAGIWTNDLGRAHRVARRVAAGQVFVNGYGVGGGVEIPFGGYRGSGFGRVKGIAGALEYTRLKNVWINHG